MQGDDEMKMSKEQMKRRRGKRGEGTKRRDRMTRR
jgi:hypothetical protein